MDFVNSDHLTSGFFLKKEYEIVADFKTDMETNGQYRLEIYGKKIVKTEVEFVVKLESDGDSDSESLAHLEYQANKLLAA